VWRTPCSKERGVWCTLCSKITTLPACDALFAAKMKACDALYVSKLQLFWRMMRYLQPLCNKITNLWVCDTLFVAKLEFFWREKHYLQLKWRRVMRCIFQNYNFLGVWNALCNKNGGVWYALCSKITTSSACNTFCSWKFDESEINILSHFQKYIAEHAIGVDCDSYVLTKKMSLHDRSLTNWMIQGTWGSMS